MILLTSSAEKCITILHIIAKLVYVLCTEVNYLCVNECMCVYKRYGLMKHHYIIK